LRSAEPRDPYSHRDENLHVRESGLNINIDLRSDHIDLEGAPRRCGAS